MFYEEFYTGEGWAVRRITNKEGCPIEPEMVANFGNGIYSFLKARAKAKELNEENTKMGM
jgi:hypothetical protein